MDNAALIAQLAVDAQAARILDPSTKVILARRGDGSEQLIGMEPFLPNRVRFRGTYATSYLSEFASYVKAHSGGAGFIDAKACKSTVFFNLGDETTPGHADWRAVLALEPTAGYAAVSAVHGMPLTQRELVEWAEDWAANLGARVNGEDVAIQSAIVAMRNLKVSANAEARHVDKDFGATRSTLEAIEASADGGLPTHLLFDVEPYTGFDKRTFALRVSVVTGDKPRFTLRIVSRESIEEAIAQEFKAKLLDAVSDTATMAIGTFTP